MKTSARLKKLRPWLVTAAVLALYPSIVLAYTWTHVLQSDLPGGGHGPLDAYRHTLASAFVAYTLGSPTVELITQVMERHEKRSSVMDRHNNLLGAKMGAASQTLSVIEPAVSASVANGQINSTDINQTTWLPPQDWRQGKLW